MRWHVPFAAVLLAAGPASADFSDGLEAYDAGRYSDALAEWRVLAADGHLESMVAIAGLFEAGTGVARDHRQAALWYRRAADCGHMVAQLNLGDLYIRGKGVERDLVSADVYLTLATLQGNSWARDRRAGIRAIMSAAQKAASAARVSASSQRCGPFQDKAAGDGS